MGFGRGVQQGRVRSRGKGKIKLGNNLLRNWKKGWGEGSLLQLEKSLI